jgi:CubicO group peptidase (beta-lactamase class C family)
MYREAQPLQSKNLQEMIDKLARIPLLYQPGTRWTYSMSMDIEGYIVEKLSGQSLPDFFEKNIFSPLGMRDAGFFVPETKRARFSALYTNGPDGVLTPIPAGGAGGRARDYEAQPALASGGGGMVSTAEDYYRFAEMLLQGGEGNGARLLSPSTVKLMTWDWIPDNAARLWLWVQRRGGFRPCDGQSFGREGHVFLGWRGGNLVLDRSDE